MAPNPQFSFRKPLLKGHEGSFPLGSITDIRVHLGEFLGGKDIRIEYGGQFESPIHRAKRGIPMKEVDSHRDELLGTDLVWVTKEVVRIRPGGAFKRGGLTGNRTGLDNGKTGNGEVKKGVLAKKRIVAF